jgi:hypothetical protein
MLSTESLLSVSFTSSLARYGGDVAVGADVADGAFYFAAHARNTTGAELVIDGGNTVQLYPIIPKE